MYHVKNKTTSFYGTVIGIKEYSKKNKWINPKRTIGNVDNHLTDEQLNDFIDEFKPEEINFIILDKKGEYHYVDFPIDDLQ